MIGHQEKKRDVPSQSGLIKILQNPKFLALTLDLLTPFVLSRDQARCECETARRVQPNVALGGVNVVGTPHKSSFL